jgi:hypothetical protein
MSTNDASGAEEGGAYDLTSEGLFWRGDGERRRVSQHFTIEEWAQYEDTPGDAGMYCMMAYHSPSGERCISGIQMRDLGIEPMGWRACSPGTASRSTIRLASPPTSRSRPSAPWRRPADGGRSMLLRATRSLAG